MRHFLSLLLGLVIAPVAWAVGGYGQSRLDDATEAGLSLNGATMALAVLAGAGLLYGLVAATRLSPLGPVAAGLILLAGQLAYVARPERITGLLPKQVFGAEGALTLPAQTGLAAVLGGGLLMAVFSIGRWRKWPKPEHEYSFLDDSPAAIGAPTPAGARKSYDDPVSDEATRAYPGATAGTGYGYGSDEPTQQAWPDSPEPAGWQGTNPDPAADSEQTSRLPGSATAGAGGPWAEPPRR